MIDQQTKQRILDTAQILDVVSDFVSLRRQGVSYVGLCPFHSDRKPSFYVSPAKNICKCFACGEGGTPLNFIMKLEQLSYSEALKYLARKYHIEVVEREETEEEKLRNNERESLFVVNDYAAKYFQEQLHSPEGEALGLSYFTERGIRPETIAKFGLGYSPSDRHAFTTQALQAGYPLKRLVDVGLSIQYEDRPESEAIDRFRGRVIFPIRNLSGRYVAFGGRILSHREKTAKYVNSPESFIYSKGRELYGLYWAKSAITSAKKCYLVEGYTDVLSMHQAGIENVVASSGTALTIDQIRLIRRFTNQVTVLYDGDAAGIKAALRGIDLLLEEGLRIKVVLLPEGEDPDSFARTHSTTELQHFLDEAETDFIHFKIELYREEMQRDPLRRAELITDVVRSIALIPDSIQRAVLIQSSASLLQMSEQVLHDEMARLRRQRVTAHQPQPGFGTARALPAEPSPSAAAPGSEVPLSDESQAPLIDVYSIEPYEKEIMQLLLLYSDRQILIPEGMATAEYEGEIYPSTPSLFTLAPFIERELLLIGADSTYSQPFAQFMQELRTECIEKGENPRNYFTNHPEDRLREIATTLVGESDLLEFRPDTESIPTALRKSINPELGDQEAEQLHEERYLGGIVIRACNSYKMALLIRLIQDLYRELKEAQRTGDTAAILDCMNELHRLNQEKQKLSNLLGDRTIIG